MNGLPNHASDALRWRGVAFFGGGGGSTNTVQKSDPWSGQQPYLTDVLSQAQGLDQNNVPQYYPNNTYQPLTPSQQGLISGMIGQSYGTPSLQAAEGSATSTLSPNYTAGTSGAFGQGQNVLSNELSPGYLNPWNSPSFGTVVNNTLASVLPATTASFVNGGRTDSGLAQRAATMAATDAVGNLAQNQFNTNQQIQQNAAGQAANNYLTQQGNQIKTQALAPMIDQAAIGDIGTGLNAAGMQQQDLQNQINAGIQKWNYNQMLPWNQLGMYNSLVQGNYGGTTTTTQPYYSNTGANLMSGLIGGGTLGASLLAPALGMGSAAGGGIGAGLGALLAFSDRNLKTDIEKIGRSDSGFPLYTFRYKGEPEGVRHIGLMAQDVQKKRPEAVLHTPRGMMVDYLEALAA